MANNLFGLDVDYFHRWIERELNPQSVGNQKPADLARVFARMAKAADANVLLEAEFNGGAHGTVPRYKFNLLVDHCKRQDDEIADLRRENNRLRYYHDGNVWHWQGDGGDHLESLCCPVVIEPADLLAMHASSDQPLNKAAGDVLAERRRQVEAEGWTPEHDDQHDTGDMAAAAACYAMFEAKASYNFDPDGPQTRWPWPWDMKWWKPRSHRENCIRAGALILAEIERLDRAQDASAGGAL
ncbi:hypothetical protein I5F71_03050 [Pseudomonas aeruginosa]|nr:hypothetical protein [Pseudomonas aeruginosa]MBG4718224.1 hypothetical protein [Pseudomonas aeruginosa]